MQQRQRAQNVLRDLHFQRNYTQHAEGSVLVSMGHTRVLCTVSILEGVPRWMKDKHQGGWLTAEYGMLPRSTHERIHREAAKGKQSGRTQEIQRLIGRSLRAMLDLKKLGAFTIVVDCDVIQADGGTRTAAINGGCVAVIDALRHLQHQGILKTDPLRHFVGAISVGIHNGKPILDLDYVLDSTAETDMNIVMTDENQFIEIQGTAENAAFSFEELQTLLQLAKQGINDVIEKQKQALS